MLLRLCTTVLLLPAMLLSCIAALPPVMAAEDLAKIDLARGAKVFASHVTPGAEFAIANAIDGDAETKWVGEDHPLMLQPTNIVIEFDAPRPVRRVVLVSQVHRERLALKDFEVYAWGEKTWAGATPLAVKRETRDVKTVVDFEPVETRRLRIRIRDTWRDDHCFPRLHEIEVYAAPAATAARKLQDSPIRERRTRNACSSTGRWAGCRRSPARSSIRPRATCTTRGVSWTR